MGNFCLRGLAEVATIRVFGLMDPSLFSFRVERRWLPLLMAALFAFVACLYTHKMPEEWGYENSPIENAQMVVLTVGAGLCATARNHRSFYRLSFFVMLLFLLREVNFGRAVFFPVEGQPNTFYKWQDIPYGWLAHWLIGAYIAALAVYFVCRKLWISLWEILRVKAFPVWGILFMVIGAVLNFGEEMILEDYVAEEIAELGMYFAFIYLVAVYTRRPEEVA